MTKAQNQWYHHLTPRTKPVTSVEGLHPRVRCQNISSVEHNNWKILGYLYIYNFMLWEAKNVCIFTLHCTKYKDKGLNRLYLCQISKSIKGSEWWYYMYFQCATGYAYLSKKCVTSPITVDHHWISCHTVHHNSGLGVDYSLSLWSILSTSKLNQKLYQFAIRKSKSWGLSLLFHGIKETDLCHTFIILMT